MFFLNYKYEVIKLVKLMLYFHFLAHEDTTQG